MVVNKNALHDIVMSYIPTKKNINETQNKKIAPPAIFKGPIPTLHQTEKTISKIENNLVKQPSIIISRESPKVGNQSLISTINVEQNIKKNKKKKHIEPLEKSTVERLIEHKEKSNFIHNLVSKSEPNSRKLTPRSNQRTNSRKQRNYMKKNIIDTKIYESNEQNNKSFRDFKIKLDSSRQSKKGGSKKKNKSKSKSKTKSKTNSIKIKNSAPSNLRYDLERLLNDSDNIAFQRIR